MSKIKVSGTASESTVHAEKDLQLVRQQAEMKAGEALFREVSRKITEQREQSQADDTDQETESGQPKDTADIYSTRPQPYSSGAGSADQVLKWLLEMAGEDWEAFLEWLPDPSLPLPDQLQELSRLYLKLLEYALKYAEGENQTEQLARLDSLLAEKLNLVMDQNLEALTSLLEKTGENAALDSIRSSLYRQTAGQTLSPQAAHILFAQGTPAQTSARVSVHSQTDRSLTASPSFSGEGMIYQPSRKQNARFQQACHTQESSWKQQLGQRQETIRNARNGIAPNTFRQTGPASCSGREMEMANRFSAHVNGSGNLFRNPDITARNEEVTGLLAAVMSIKGQVYTEKAGQTSSLALSLQNAIAKIVKQYLGRRGAADVYNHTLTAYRQLKSPQKAIQAGQDYAYQRFREKQRDPAFQKSAPYAREAGFFRSFLNKLSPEKEFSLGAGILREDWQNFLHTLGTLQYASYLSRAAGHSPWGILASPGASQMSIGETTVKILLGVSVVILIGVLAVVWLRPI